VDDCLTVRARLGVGGLRSFGGHAAHTGIVGEVAL
jgi:hypothetical protein